MDPSSDSSAPSRRLSLATDQGHAARVLEYNFSLHEETPSTPQRAGPTLDEDIQSPVGAPHHTESQTIPETNVNESDPSERTRPAPSLPSTDANANLSPPASKIKRRPVPMPAAADDVDAIRPTTPIPDYHIGSSAGNTVGPAVNTSNVPGILNVPNTPTVPTARIRNRPIGPHFSSQATWADWKHFLSSYQWPIVSVVIIIGVIICAIVAVKKEPAAQHSGVIWEVVAAVRSWWKKLYDP